MMLFSHGVNSVGVTPIDDWRGLLRRAQKDGEFFGVDERAYPHDFAVFARYSSELAKKIKSYYRWPPAMALEQLKVFIARNEGRYPVKWRDAAS